MIPDVYPLSIGEKQKMGISKNEMVNKWALLFFQNCPCFMLE
jgi:hypothetical protein